MPKTRRGRFAVYSVLLLPVLLTGCGNPPQASSPATEVKAQPASYRQTSPEQYLRGVFDRYRSAESYHDRGVVRLDYSVGGQAETKMAPLHVWFDRNELYVQAYDVQIWSDARGLMAWINDQQTDNFDAQVLRTEPLRRRPTVEWLFADPILREQVAAGLAGPPPQLEWLFAADSMKELFRREHRFSFDDSDTIDSRRCRSVRVQADSEIYRFWVDEDSGIIRRIGFPSVVAAPVAGQPPLRMELTMDLVGAAFDSPTQTPDAKPLPTEPRYVTQFVPLPPPEPARIIGTHPDNFSAKTRGGRITISDQGSDRDATITIRFAGDPLSIAAVATLQQWHRQVQENLLTKIRLVVLAPPELADQLAKQIALPIAIDQGDQIARALDLAPGALVIQDKSGRIAWMQSDLSQPGVVTLGAIVADVIQGVNVPSRLRDQWQEQQDAYELALTKVAATR